MNKFQDEVEESIVLAAQKQGHRVQSGKSYNDDGSSATRFWIITDQGGKRIIDCLDDTSTFDYYEEPTPLWRGGNVTGQIGNDIRLLQKHDTTEEEKQQAYGRLDECFEAIMERLEQYEDKRIVKELLKSDLWHIVTDLQLYEAKK